MNIQESGQARRLEEVQKNSRPVNTGDRFLSLLLAALGWVLVLCLDWNLDGNSEKGFRNIAAVFGVYAFTFGLVIAAFVRTRNSQKWFRWLSFWVIPGNLIALVAVAEYLPLSDRAFDYFAYAMQFVFLFYFYLIYRFKTRRKHYS